MRRFDVFARVAVHRERARHEEVKEHAERIDVARWRERGAEHTFGRQVQRRTGQPPCVGPDQRLAGAEVHQHDASAALAHHVVRLQVGVDVALGMDCDQRAAQLSADGGGFLGAHRAVRLDFGRERPAVDELHPQADAAVRLTGAEDPDDVGMPDPREEAPFLEDAALEVGKVDAGVEELQRDDAVQRIEGPVDGAEGASADGLEHGQVAPRRALERRSDRLEALWIPEQVRHVGQRLQAFDEPAGLAVAGLLQLALPIDGLALIDARGQVVDSRGAVTAPVPEGDMNP